jgi:predicted Rossmann fold nucleotide-binding protein DprA/Smf involved in DNA uptake
MSATAPRGSCRRCARRDWLLGELCGPLDALAAHPERLWATLELGEQELIAALGGTRREDLHERWERWTPHRASEPARPRQAPGRAVCRHHCLYPTRLRDDPLAPHALLLEASTATRLGELHEQKIVAIAGTHAPDDYGVRVARRIAGELATAGVTVAGAATGVGAAARVGALAAGGSTIAVSSVGVPRGDTGLSGTERGRPSRECRIAEPAGRRARSWPLFADERTLALLAELVIVVQASEQTPLDLACAAVARLRGVPVTAMPGPAYSPASQGSNLLLASGAHAVCCAGDALDVLLGLRPIRSHARRPGVAWVDRPP